MFGHRQSLSWCAMSSSLWGVDWVIQSSSNRARVAGMTSQVSLILAEVEPDDLTYLGVFRIQISGPQRSAVPRRLTSQQLRYLINGRIDSKTLFYKVVKKVLIYLSSGDFETAKILLADLERIEVEGFKLGSCLLLEIQCWIHIIRQEFRGPSVTAARPRIRLPQK